MFVEKNTSEGWWSKLWRESVEMDLLKTLS